MLPRLRSSAVLEYPESRVSFEADGRWGAPPIGAKVRDLYLCHVGVGLSVRNGHQRAFDGRASTTPGEDIDGRGGDTAVGRRAP